MFEEISSYNCKEWSYHWTPDSSKLLVAENDAERLHLVNARTRTLVSSVQPGSPLRAVLGWGQGQQVPVLLCAGQSAAGAQGNPCPVQSMTVQGGGWSILSPPIAGAAVFVSFERGPLAALSPSAKTLAVINAASPTSPWSVQFLDIAAGFVVAQWAAPAGSELGWASLEWANNGNRLWCKTSGASYLIELDVSG